MTWFLNFISIPGAWRGLIYILMAAGIRIDPDLENAIIAAGLALSGLIHAYESGKKSKE